MAKEDKRKRKRWVVVNEHKIYDIYKYCTLNVSKDRQESFGVEQAEHLEIEFHLNCKYHIYDEETEENE